MRNSMRLLVTTLLVTAVTLLVLPAAGYAERVKDIASISGVRTNQLVGYGLVVGLDGTGDKTGQAPFAAQSLISMLNRFGVVIPPGTGLTPKNIAGVTITAELPPFAKPGQTIDITVSTIGNAKSLRGGTLLMSPLQGADGKVYAIAQGNLVVGGFGASTEDGNSISVNIPTVGRIPNGASVERPAPSMLGSTDSIRLNLHNPDFTTVKRLADAINKAVGEGTATPTDVTSVEVNAPQDIGQRVSFVALLENILVEPGDAPARVIINSRSGTVVIGKHVRVTPAAVAHGNLTVTISNATRVSQPSPFGQGDTEVVQDSDISIEEQSTRMFLFAPGVSLDEIVRAINQVGAAPSDLVAILEALRQVSALRAELIVI